MKKDSLLKVGGAAIAIGVAAFLFIRWWNEPGADEIPGGLYFICGNADCKNEFHMSLDEFKSKKNADWVAPCPKCNQFLSFRAYLCPNCSKPFRPVGHGDPPKICPNCKKPIPGGIG